MRRELETYVASVSYDDTNEHKETLYVDFQAVEQIACDQQQMLASNTSQAGILCNTIAMINSQRHELTSTTLTEALSATRGDTHPERTQLDAVQVDACSPMPPY